MLQMAPSLIDSENSSSINNARLQTGRRRGGDPLAAAAAAAAEQVHLGHIRADGGQLDALIDLLRDLRRVGERRLAFRAGWQAPVDRAIRVRMQGPSDASRAVSAAISASFSAWLSWAGAGISGTRRADSTRA
jgi:hypothetical protein